MSMLLLVGFALLGPATAATPNYLSALSYDLTFTLDMTQMQQKKVFSGDAIIKLKTSEKLGVDQYNFVLHGRHLDLKYIEVVYPSSRKDIVVLANVDYNETSETITIPVKEALTKSSVYTIKLIYVGKIDTDVGLVLSKKDNDSYLTTSLYPVFARRLYPCLDEPNMRANYTVSFRNVDNNYVIVTGLKTNQKIDNLQTYYSEYSLPPYGIAFAVGKYANFNGIYFPPTEKFSQDVNNALKTKTITDLLEAANVVDHKLVIVPGLPVDSVSGYCFSAISTDIGIQASETTYFATNVKQMAILKALTNSVYRTVVSPAAWNDIWIAESVSLYISSLAFKQIKGNESPENKAIIEIEQVALDRCWSESSSPVIPNSFASADDIVKFVSDPAIYKGSSILGMIESIKESTSSCFNSLVKERKGKSISTDEVLDYYEVCEKLNGTLPEGIKLKALVNPWFKQSGYPGVTIHRKNKAILASQSRFMPNKNEQPTWIIPLQYTQTGNSRINSNIMMKWLKSDPNTQLQLADNVGVNDTVTANTKGLGLYRVLYEDDIQLLGNELSSNINYATSEIRTAIISDGLAFAAAGSLRYSYLLPMLKFLKNERDLLPWRAASKGLSDMWSLLYFTDLKNQFENYATDLLRSSYISDEIGGLGLDDTDPLKAQLRKTIVSQLCDYGDFNCRNDTTTFFNENMGHEKARKPVLAFDMIQVLYCNGLRNLNDSQELLEYLKLKYNPNKQSDLKRDVFSYLACAQPKTTITGYLNEVLFTNMNILPEDIVVAFEEVARRPEQIDLLLDFFTKNYSKLNPKLTIKQKAQMVQALGQTVSTSNHLKMLDAFNPGKDSLVNDAVSEVKSIIKQRQTFLKANYDEIKVGLYGHDPAPTSTTDTPTKPIGPTPKPTAPTPKSTKKPSGAANISAALGLIVTSLIASWANY